MGGERLLRTFRVVAFRLAILIFLMFLIVAVWDEWRRERGRENFQFEVVAGGQLGGGHLGKARVLGQVNSEGRQEQPTGECDKHLTDNDSILTQVFHISTSFPSVDSESERFQTRRVRLPVAHLER